MVCLFQQDEFVVFGDVDDGFLVCIEVDLFVCYCWCCMEGEFVGSVVDFDCWQCGVQGVMVFGQVVGEFYVFDCIGYDVYGVIGLCGELVGIGIEFGFVGGNECFVGWGLVFG